MFIQKASWVQAGIIIKKDQSNVVSIKNKFSKVKLISYPIITEYENFLINKKLKIKEIKFFDYLDLDFINMKKNN